METKMKNIEVQKKIKQFVIKLLQFYKINNIYNVITI